jgi:acyl dehydratase
MKTSISAAKVGDIRVGRARKLTLARALALSGGPFDKPNWPDKNLHTDAAAATDAGLSEIVVSGTQWEGYVVGLLVETFGKSWFEGGVIDIKIPRSVKIDETIQPKLRFEEIVAVDNERRATVKVWCENAEQMEVLVGSASCVIRETGTQLEST